MTKTLLKNSLPINKLSINKLFSNTHAPIILNTNALHALQNMPSGLVDVAVTSPPYWNQRDYQTNGELGKESTPEEYIEKLLEINMELYRVLKNTGVYFLNIGDKYHRKSLQMIPERLAIKMVENGYVIRNKIIWHKTNPNPSPITDRFTNAYEVIYMFVKDTDNYTTPDYYFDLDKIRIPHKTQQKTLNDYLPRTISIKDFEKYSKMIRTKEYNGKFKGQQTINVGASAGGRLNINGEYYSLQRKHHITKQEKIEIIKMLRTQRKKIGVDIPHIDYKLGTTHTAGHWFRLDDGGSSLPDPIQWNKLKKILELGNTKYDNIMTEQHYVLQTVRHHEKGKNPSDVWEMATSSIKEKHFAPFPEKLPEMCIKACCPKNGIVLDPFCGSGTTLKVAQSLHNNSIGIELNPTYINIIKRIVGKDVTVLKM